MERKQAEKMAGQLLSRKWTSKRYLLRRIRPVLPQEVLVDSRAREFSLKRYFGDYGIKVSFVCPALRRQKENGMVMCFETTTGWSQREKSRIVKPDSMACLVAILTGMPILAEQLETSLLNR